MAVNAGVFCIEKNYSYQHLQGIMLGNLNRLSSQVRLSHSDYRVMGTLIGLYNKCHAMAFPTIDQLTKYCCMGRTTILKSLNNLVSLNLLIIVKTPGKRNNYYFSNLILSDPGSPHVKPSSSLTCENTHDKQIKKETNKDKPSLENNNNCKNLSNQKNDDVIKINTIDLTKNSNNSNYKEALKYLESINFHNPRAIINKYGLKKTIQAIEIVKENKPNKPAGYLHSLLKVEGELLSLDSKTNSRPSEEPLINQMVKHKFWIHKPSGKIFQVLPEIGTHLLIKYYKKEEMITFIESGFTDKLKNFTSIDI